MLLARRASLALFPAVISASLVGCAADSTVDGSSSSGAATGSGGAPASSSSSGFGTGNSSSSGNGVCEPPDLLIALDRTLTMHFMPNGVDPADAPAYASSKWSQAITAIEALVTPKVDQTIRFGLELWPKEEPGCITLAERVENTKMATNAFCEDGEVLASPALGASGTIPALLDPTTTKICISTPTGKGLLTASAHLESIAKAGRDQFILLVTDGADWDASCPDPNPLDVTRQIAAAGVKTFILGFSATGDIMPNGIGAPFLNDMACAGGTAIDFATNCVMGPNGYQAKDPNGPTLYFQASDAAALSKALDAVAALVCCDCVQ
ncbi:MAG: vWA domain-containing protein [Polyangiaceae bacterium]